MDASGFIDRIRNLPWHLAETVPAARWKCGYCDHNVGSNQGYYLNDPTQGQYCIRICSNCNGPTFFLFGDAEYSPSALPGESVQGVPADLASLFHEARAAAGAGALTAAVLTCRKILMHIAVEQGARPGQTFVEYVNYLVSKGFAPPNSGTWVDYIRSRSNEANHQIVLMQTHDAELLIKFIEQLLRYQFELPSMVPQASEPPPPEAPAF